MASAYSEKNLTFKWYSKNGKTLMVCEGKAQALGG